MLHIYIICMYYLYIVYNFISNMLSIRRTKDIERDNDVIIVIKPSVEIRKED